MEDISVWQTSGGWPSTCSLIAYYWSTHSWSFSEPTAMTGVCSSTVWVVIVFARFVDWIQHFSLMFFSWKGSGNITSRVVGFSLTSWPASPVQPFLRGGFLNLMKKQWTLLWLIKVVLPFSFSSRFSSFSASCVSEGYSVSLCLWSVRGKWSTLKLL